MTIKINTFKQVEEIVEIPSPFFVKRYGIVMCTQDYCLEIITTNNVLEIKILTDFNPSEYYDSNYNDFSLKQFIDDQEILKNEFNKAWENACKFLPATHATRGEE